MPTGTCCVITGAADGIGLVIIEALAAAGAVVAIVDVQG